MAKFDEVFADFQAKMDAAMEALVDYPEAAAAVKAAIFGAAKREVVIAEDRADEARANALATVVSDVAVKLTVASGETPPV